MRKLELADIEKFPMSFEVVKMLLATVPDIVKIYAVTHSSLFEFSHIYIECSSELSQTELSNISQYILDSVCCDEEICEIYKTDFMVSVDYDISCVIDYKDSFFKNESESLLNTIRLTETIPEKLLFLNSYLQSVRIYGKSSIDFLEQFNNVEAFMLSLAEFASHYVNYGKHVAYPYYKNLMKYNETLNQLSSLLNIDLVIAG